MIKFYSRKHLILFVCSIAIFLPRWILAQNCGCEEGSCCSKWGYCGTGNSYCGQGCQGGPCYTTTPNSPNNNNNNSYNNNKEGTTSDMVTESFFNGIANQAASSCDGKGFYTRAAFLEALNSYPRFATVGSSSDTKREIAAFFAHVTHETGHMCYISEINGPSRNYCDEQNIEYPCVSGKKYYGRGPIQLSWNFNYGPAGKDIGFDGLNDPDIVARDNVIAFKTALWYWMNNCHSLITSGLGFGPTIRAIYGTFECDGGNPPAVARRIDYFTEYCHQLGVETGNNTSC